MGPWKIVKKINETAKFYHAFFCDLKNAFFCILGLFILRFNINLNVFFLNHTCNQVPLSRKRLILRGSCPRARQGHTDIHSHSYSRFKSIVLYVVATNVNYCTFVHIEVHLPFVRPVHWPVDVLL